MPNLGFPEILIILVVALLVFGPKKLPDLGRSLGNGIREFRKGTAGLKEEFEGSLRETPAPQQTISQPYQAAPAQPAPQPEQALAASFEPQPVQVGQTQTIRVTDLSKPEDAPRS